VKALVTGGAGFIGSATARALLTRGDEVSVLDDLFSGFEENLPAEAEFVRGDIRDLETVEKACRGVDVVFHLAAVRSVPRSVDNPLLSHEVNATGTLSVLTAAEKAGVRRVIYASSSSVYGGTDDGRPSREEDMPRPSSPYAASKLAGELYCAVWSRLKGLSTVSLRYFNVFGPGQHPESKYAAVFPAFCSALVESRPPEVNWDGEQARSFTYVDDVARANLLAADAGPEVDGAVINISGGRPVTVNEVLTAVSQAVGRWIEPVRTPRRPGDVRYSDAEIDRARRLLGWAPEASWDDSVAATVEWFAQTGVGRA
jgi:nucleoside-diphosphate-sugar epimerase